MRVENEKEEAEFGYVQDKKRRRMNNTLTEKEKLKETLEEAKLRQIYNPISKTFDYSKKCVTDMQENSYVHLPKGANEKIENEIGMLRELILGEFSKYTFYFLLLTSLLTFDF